MWHTLKKKKKEEKAVSPVPSMMTGEMSPSNSKLTAVNPKMCGFLSFFQK